MDQPLASTAATTGGQRARRRLVTLLVALTAVATFVSSVAVWSRNVLLDTDAWVEAVGPLSDNPEITRAVATYLVDQVAVAVDLEQLAADALPGRSKVLAAPLTTSLRSFLTDQADELLRSQRFGTLWIEANRAAHRTAVRLLRGEPGAIAATDGVVTLNLLPALTWLLERVESTGLLPDGYATPSVTFATPPAEAIAALSAAVGRDLPADFAQIEVFDDRSLAQAQDAVALFERLVTAMVVLTVLLAGASLVLSLDRRRTVVLLGLVVAAALLVSRAVITATGDYALRVITDEVDRSAAAAVVRQIVTSLQQIQNVIALAGVVIAAAAYLTGPSARAQRARAALRRSPRTGADGPSAHLDDRLAPWAARVDRHRDLLRAAGVLGAMAAVAWIDPTFARLGWIVLVLVAYQAAITIVAGRSTIAPAASAAPDAQNQR